MVLFSKIYNWFLAHKKPIRFQKDRSSPPDVLLGKVIWKYAANLQENIHAKV